MLDGRAITHIKERGSVIGLIMAQHRLNEGIRHKRTKTLDESFEVIRRHIDEIHKITASH
jgi:hypothetical protein